MVVQHNLTAMNSNRMLGLTTKTQSKSTERLSSGYKINRAADDAAGLSISEKMRKQIRGLTQASANAQDGISSVQTAEGALTEVHDMLQRMNELTIKAANGTNSETDRSYIQSEIDQLVTEIDRVSTTTKFNETYLLKGTNSDGTVAKLSFDTATDNIGTKIGGIDLSFDEDGIATNATWATADSSSMTESGTSLSTANTTTSTDQSSSEASTTTTYTVDEGKQLEIDDTTYKLYEGATDEELKKTGLNGDNTFTSRRDFEAAVKKALDGLGVAEDVKSVSVGKEGLKVTAFADLNDALNMSLHVGADPSKDNKIGLDINMMSARGLGINGLKVDGDTDANATAAIDVIKDAIQKVSEQRSTLGAVQNRLEHTVNNLDNIVENTTSAESAIRDTDMATEMVKYSNNQILAQAGQAMLAQANQANQGVLSLLG